ncbi:MAG TPA: helix-turn-helix domain-containing protein [Anaeromyxobacter sp.]
MDDFISTDEFARLAGVGPSAVKRWSDAGALPCLRTAGGHRRFRREDVERFLRSRGAPAAADLVDLLLDDPDSRRTEARLLSERARRGAWHKVADGVGPALADLGRRWQSGKLTILEEHLASSRLARALARIAANVPVDPGAPRALLSCAEGDEHTLGLALAEVCLREAGWNVLWSGRGTPLAELRAPLLERAVAMIVLSASEFSSDGASLARQAARVGAWCRDAGATLVLGGSGAWPDPPPPAVRVTSFDPFHRLAGELRARAEGRPPTA